MLRVPIVNPKVDREKARLLKLLATLERIPVGRREAECADERAATVRMLLRELTIKGDKP